MDLPEELMADVLRRLRPRYLAACRSVCRCWRAVVDGHGLLLARHVRGIFINFAGRERPSFFSRNAAAPRTVDAALSFLPSRRFLSSEVLDHHNGLLLCEKKDRVYVCNPATRRWKRLPQPRIRWHSVRRPLYLVFDPTVALHYNVLLFPEAPCWPNHELDVSAVGSMEWPPRVYTVHVFSSRTGRWEEKQFIREGDAAIAVSDVWSSYPWCTFRRYAVYWRQGFYLHCHGGFVLRLSLLDGKYLVIPTPKLGNCKRQPRLGAYQFQGEEDDRGTYTPYVYLSRSEQGVYFTALGAGYKLSVWVLHETSDLRRMPKWELKHQADLESSFLRNSTQRRQSHEQEIESWILDPREEGSSEDSRNHHEWDSDDDVVVNVEEGRIKGDEHSLNPYHGMNVLGYHPYKEIVFLDGRHFGGYAYYLGTSKLEFLGSLEVVDATDLFGSLHPAPAESFIYTPCMEDLLPTCIDNDLW